jgi:hypothetical protein
VKRKIGVAQGHRELLQAKRKRLDERLMLARRGREGRL